MGDASTPVASEPVEPSSTAQPPRDPASHDVADALPGSHSEVHRQVVDGDGPALLVVSVPEEENDAALTASLFVAEGSEMPLADRQELACLDDFSVDEDDGMAFVRCDGTGSARWLWVVGRRGPRLEVHPDPADQEDPSGWQFADVEREPRDGVPDDLVIWQNDCSPGCAEGSLIATHLRYAPDARAWEATGCTDSDGRRHAFDEPRAVSSSPLLDDCLSPLAADDPEPQSPPATLTEATFVLPSGNIGCLWADYSEGPVLRCDLHSGLSPEPKVDCDFDWVGTRLAPTGPGRPNCAGDTNGVTRDNAPVLPYGARWSRGGVTCHSSESGLRCENSDGGGMFLSRRAWDAW